MFSVRKSVKRLTDRFLLPEEATISGIDLCRKFNANPRGSLKALLTLMNQIADSARPMEGSTHPYFRRQTPDPQDYRDYDSDSNPLAPTSTCAMLSSLPVVSRTNRRAAWTRPLPNSMPGRHR